MTGDSQSRGESGHRYAVLSMLTAIYALNFLDRQLISILAEPIRQDLQLTDTQLGLLGGIIFVAFYASFGIPVGWLADRFNRVRIIAFACGLWSLFTVVCGFANNFTQMALARVGVGVGEAGGTPPSYSLISDYFAPSERGTALAVFSMATPAGAMFGAAFGGFIAAEYGWRVAFFSLGIPGLILALLLVIFAKEPDRGRLDDMSTFEGATHAAPKLGEAITSFLGNPVLVRVAVASALSALLGYAATAWFPPFLMRVKGMSLRELAAYYSLVVGITGMAGIFLSGLLADRLMPKDPRWAVWLPAIALFISLPFWVGVLLAPTWQIALAFLIVPSLANPFFLAPALAVVQNMVAPSRRTVSGAILLFIINMIGLGGGPLYVGWISDMAASRYGTASLTIGLAALIPIVVLAICLQMFAARAIGKARARASTS